MNSGEYRQRSPAFVELDIERVNPDSFLYRLEDERPGLYNVLNTQERPDKARLDTCCIRQ
jgi:hypothetical protein